MKRIVANVILLLLVAGVAFSQVTPVDPADLGSDTAQQRLQEVSVTRFEDPGMWSVFIPADRGVISHRRFEGGPAGKEPIEAEVAAGIDEQDDFVLGVKAEFYRRGHAPITVTLRRPLAISGIVKTISVWVVGRNFNHELDLVVEDQAGNRNFLNFGRLNHSGWGPNAMTVAVPQNIVQQDLYSNTTGLYVHGFVIRPELTETFGSFYIYFDDMRATTDLFPEVSRDPDDMSDNW